MANNIPTPPPEDSLAGAGRMLDGINNLQTPGRNAGRLRAMFTGPVDANTKTIKATEAKLERGFSQAPRKPFPSGPSL